MKPVVLFDLDGTLADTAPDLALALNLTRADHGLAPVPAERLRPQASHGARGLIGEGMGLVPGDPAFDDARDRFLAHYRANLCVHTRLFDGIEALLAALEANGHRWGIVTNKPGWLSAPLIEALQLHRRAACLISGDTTPTPKPHPAPLLLACRQLDVPAADCVYVGDDRRDVDAGRAAGMRTAVACWGYIGADDNPRDWPADLLLDSPGELLAFPPMANIR